MASRAFRRAERHVTKGVQHLSDAATALREAGCEQQARHMDSAANEATIALSLAESRLLEHTKGGA